MGAIASALVNPRIGRTIVPVLTLGLLLFLLFTGSYFFSAEGQWTRWQPILVAFLFMSVIAYLLAPESFQIPASQWTIWFIAGAAAGFALFLAARGGLPTGLFPSGNIVPVLILTWVTASAEEAFFRGLLARPTGKVGLGILISAAAFSLFHISSYAGLSPYNFLFAFGMGLLLGAVFIVTSKFSGTGVVTGIHFSYNAVILLFLGG